MYCVAKNCKNRSWKRTQHQLALEAKREITFHKFPKNNEIRKIWLKNMGLSEAELPRRPFLCCMHFNEEAFIGTSVNSSRLHPESIPMDCSASATTEFIVESETPSETRDSPHQSLHMAGVLEDSITIQNEPILIPEQLFMRDLPLQCADIGYPVTNKLRELHSIRSKNISEDESEPFKKQQCINEITDNASKSQHVAVHLSQNTAAEVITFKIVVDEAGVPSFIEPNVHPILKTRSTSVSPDRFRSPVKPEYADKATSVSRGIHYRSPHRRNLRSLLKAQAWNHAKKFRLLREKYNEKEEEIYFLRDVLNKL